MPGIFSLGITSDGKTLLLASFDQGLRAYDSDTGKTLLHCVPLGEPPFGSDHDLAWAAFSPDGRYVVTDSTDPSVRLLWDMDRGVYVDRIDMGSAGVAVTSGLFLPDGTFLVETIGGLVCHFAVNG